MKVLEIDARHAGLTDTGRTPQNAENPGRLRVWRFRDEFGVVIIGRHGQVPKVWALVVHKVDHNSHKWGRGKMDAPTADEMREIMSRPSISRWAAMDLHFPALIAMRERVDELQSELAAATVHRCELERQLATAKAEIERLKTRPLYEQLCECGDFESSHQGGGPCEICCQSSRGGDGCEMFKPSGTFEKLTDVQKGIV